MKHSKKVVTSVLVLLSLFLLVSCKKDQNKDPFITGVNHVEVEVGTGKTVLGDVFEPLAGVKATDPKEGDLTADIVFDNGGYSKDVVGVYTMKYSVTNKSKITAEVIRKVEVVEARTFANGLYNYKFAESELRNTFFGAAESYLLDNVYGGVPLFVNSGMSIYSDRVQLPVEQYVPVMGWGSKFGTLTKDDANLNFVGGGKGVAGEYTYRGTFSSNPTTFNQWLSDDSVSSDAASFMLDSLYDFHYNENLDGYEVVPSMAAANPTAIGGEMIGGTQVSKTWVVPIKDDLKFTFHPNTNFTGFDKNDNEITAQTFVDTFKYAIDNSWFRAIAGGSHFWSTSSPVANAKTYYDAKDTSASAWEEVGIKVVDGNSIQYTFDTELSMWNLQYWLSSNTMSPVYLPMAKALGTAYGTTPETTAYTGPYYLSNFQSDKLLEYKAAENFHTPELYNYTGYNFAIIERAELVFEEFKSGNLDASGIPLTEYDNYKDNKGVRRSPGTTTFRMNINALGTAENQAEKFPTSKWNPVPILANDDFRKALYFGIDRKALAHDVLKTSDPGMYLFSDAYLVDADKGQSFRETDQGKEVGKDLNPASNGFSPDRAKQHFLDAVKQSVGNGDVKRGTKKNPTKIALEVAVQAGSTAQAQLGSYVKTSYENLFKDTVNHVQVEINVVPVEFPNIYYSKQLVGDFDLGMGGISGSSLDASSFLEVFSSDNRGGFTLNWGFDTSLPNIPVTYDKPNENGGTTEVTEYWSFDGIVSVLNGSIFMKDGREDFTVQINEVIAEIDALPSIDNLTIEDADAVYKAEANFYSLTPGAQKQVTNSDKLFALVDAMDKLVDEADAAEVDVLIADLPSLEELTLDHEDAVTAAKEAFDSLSANAKELVEDAEKLEALVAKMDELVGPDSATE